MSSFILGDCMEYMRQMPDKAYDLAIVDPPYGGVGKGGYMRNAMGINSGVAKHPAYHLALWGQSKPPQEYFNELFRVSKNQIIWGGNYFTTLINKDSQCWIVWDKKKPEELKYAMCELAWTSFDSAAKIFRYTWNGMLQEDMKNKEQKIHPTQKPVALYEWLLKSYADPGDKILDTHVGSGSSLIACENMGFEYTGFEIDETYYKLACKRIAEETAQIRIQL